MFARVTEFHGPAEAVPASQRETEEILPRLRELDGFAGILVLGDRTSGKVLAVTLWRDGKAMESSEEAAARIRSETASENDQQVGAVERFEVLVEDRGGDR